jgi:hypothetical protein
MGSTSTATSTSTPAVNVKDHVDVHRTLAHLPPGYPSQGGYPPGGGYPPQGGYPPPRAAATRPGRRLPAQGGGYPR